MLIGDWVALGLFVFLGLVDHAMIEAGGLTRLFTTTAVLALPWTAIGFILGAYSPAADTSGRTFLSRSLVAWLVAAPLALILRAFLQGQATIILAFMLVTMGLGGAFLLAWRLIYLLLRRRVRPNV